MFPTEAARTGSSIPFSDPCVVKICPATFSRKPSGRTELWPVCSWKKTMIPIAMVQTVRFVTVRCMLFKVKSPCLMINPFQSIPIHSGHPKHCQGSIPPITLHIFHRNGRQFLCTAPQLLRHRRRRTTRWTGGNSTLSSWQHEVLHVPHRKPA